MADFSRRPGWWLASDGRWYPPHLRSSPAGPPVEQRAGPPTPVGGGSALRQSQRRGDPRGLVGADGDYRVWRLLRDRLTDGEMIFSDRRVPGANDKVDHVVVASSGVWIIDAKRWRAMSYRASDPAGSVMRLFCGTRDVTNRLDTLSSYVAPVAQVVRDPTVPIHPAMTVFADQCRMKTAVRFRLGKVIRHGLVLICPPRLLVEQIRQAGPVSHDQIARIGHRLDEALRQR